MEEIKNRFECNMVAVMWSKHGDFIKKGVVIERHINLQRNWVSLS